MLNIKIESQHNEHSKVTKTAIISSGTKWSAKVTRFGLFEDVLWTLYSGQLAIVSGKTFLFEAALNEAIKCANSYMTDPLFK